MQAEYPKGQKSDLTPFAEAKPRAITGTRPIVLRLSQELYGRVETRAREERFDTHEWVLRTVIEALLRPESEILADRRARAAVRAMLSRSAEWPTNERSIHAAHS